MTQEAAQEHGGVSTLVSRAVLEATQTLWSPGQRNSLRSALGEEVHKFSLPDSGIGWAAFERLWTVACDVAGPVPFGLQVAAQIGRGRFRGVEYLVRSSATLGEGLLRLGRFHRLLFGRELKQVYPGPDGLTFLVHARGPVQSSHDAQLDELLAGVLVGLGRQATGVEWQPSQICFRHAAPADVSMHNATFGCPIHFGSSATSIKIADADLGLAMKEHDPELAATLLQYLEMALSNASARGPWTERTCTTIGAVLQSGDDSALTDVAATLGLGERSLQARLKSEGTSFQELLDDLRYELARRYLTRVDMTMPAIAQLLGYSEASAFHRAFRRWSGSTPGRFRRAGVGQPGSR